MRKFRQGGYNTLVATCVGEEGLDIGEVDLIVCFDAHKSPVRLVQRMGRTGRKRTGRIVVIVAQGKEEQVRKCTCILVCVMMVSFSAFSNYWEANDWGCVLQCTRGITLMLPEMYNIATATYVL